MHEIASGTFHRSNFPQNLRSLKGRCISFQIIKAEPVKTARVNRVWFLSVSLGTDDIYDPVRSIELVLKLSNTSWKGSKTRAEVNAMGTLRRQENGIFTIPEVLAFSDDAATSEIGLEYVLMTRLQGRPLQDFWQNISAEARRDLVRQIANVIYIFRRTAEFHEIGSFSESESIPGSIVALEYQSEAEQARKDPVRKIGPLRSFVDYVAAYIDVHLGYLVAKADAEIPASILVALRKFVSQVVLANRLRWETETFVFTHGDLNAGNILIEEDGDRPGCAMIFPSSGSAPLVSDSPAVHRFLRVRCC